MLGPYNFEYLNEYNGSRMPSGTVENSYIMRYFMRCLYQRVMSVIDFELPEEWNKMYFLNVLFRNGYIAVINTDQYGIIPQISTLTGYGLYLQPTEVVVAQPLVNFKGTIGKDCELIKLTPDYFGVWDIIEHYALELSETWTALNMALENSKISKLMGAKNKQAAETLKLIAEKVSSGEPIVVYDKKLNSDELSGEDIPIWTLSFDAGNYIVNDILDTVADLMNAFDREIGIPTLDNKKERYITSEVSAITSDSCARLHTWETCLNESIDKVNKLFNLNISFTTLSERQAEEVEVKEGAENG